MTKINVTGPQVRALRRAQKLTQVHLAARCGVLGWHLSRGTIAKIEAQVRGISDAEIFVLAKALRRPIDELYPKDRSLVLAQLNQADAE